MFTFFKGKFKALRRFIQRGRRGYADEDLWDFDSYLSEMMIDALTRFKDVCSYPGEFALPGRESESGREMWSAILDRMIDGFQANLDMNDNFPPDNWTESWDSWYEPMQTRWEVGMKLLTRYFRSLWY